MQPVNINYLTRLIKPYSSYLLQAFSKLDSYRISSKKRIEYLNKINQAVFDKISEQLSETLEHNQVISHRTVSSITNDPTWVIYGIIEPSHFLFHNPNFAYGIGYYDHGVLQHVCCFDVIRDEMFTASLGKGVQLNQKKYRLSSLAAMDSTWLNMIVDPSADWSRPASQTNGSLVVKQLSLLDFAYLATNRINLIVKPKQGLDQALNDAGNLFFQEAGGVLDDTNEQQLLPNYFQL